MNYMIELITRCLATHSKQYFSYIYDEKKFTDIMSSRWKGVILTCQPTVILIVPCVLHVRTWLIDWC